MSLSGKLVSEFEIGAAAEKFYKVLKETTSHLPNISQNFINQVEVHDGDWDSHGHGSIKIWNYTLDGKDEVFKEQVEFEDEKLSVKVTGLEGDVFNHYKIYNGIFEFVPKGPDHGLAIIVIEYEKLTEDSPYPYKYLDLLIGLIKDIESHLK